MRLILNDGYTLTNLTTNVDYFVSQTEISEDIFKNNLVEVIVINDDGTEVTHHNMELAQLFQSPDGEWMFRLQHVSKEDLRYAQTRSDIEYLAMMADVDLGMETTL